LFETESPCIHQWSYGRVECAMTLLIYNFSMTKYLGKQCVYGNGYVVVDASDNRLFVEGGERSVYGTKGLYDEGLQVFIVLVGNGVECTKYLAFLSTIDGFAIAENDDRSYYEKQEKWEMPTFVHCSYFIDVCILKCKVTEKTTITYIYRT
jgi:hypothetical protein